MVLGALAAVRALAERAHVHVIGLRAADRVLLHAEEAAGLFPLAADLLQTKRDLLNVSSGIERLRGKLPQRNEKYVNNIILPSQYIVDR